MERRKNGSNFLLNVRVLQFRTQREVRLPTGSPRLPLLEEGSFGVPAQNPLERLPEVVVEDGVYDRVQARVTVPNPEEELEQGVGDAARRRAHRHKRVGEEEGEPADHKHSHHYGQDEGEPLLTVHHGLTAGIGRPLSRRWSLRYQFGAR